MGNKGKTAIKGGLLYRQAADVTYKGSEASLSVALNHCTKWQTIMSKMNESARILNTLSEQAIASETQAKAFVSLMSMTDKSSDLYSAVQNLLQMIQAFGQMAKSEVAAKEIVMNVFKHRKTLGGEKLADLDEILAQLEAKNEALTLKFKVSEGKPGEAEVQLQVRKKQKTTPYQAKRTQMLSTALDFIKDEISEAGRSYKSAVNAILQLTEFLDMVNSFSKTKPKSEERDLLQGQMETHPLWDKFQEQVSFPEQAESFEYTMDVKSSDHKVMSEFLNFVTKAALNIVADAITGDINEPVAYMDNWVIELGDGIVEGSDLLLEAAEEEAPAEEKKPFMEKVKEKGKEYLGKAKEFAEGLAPEPMPIAASKRGGIKRMANYDNERAYIEYLDEIGTSILSGYSASQVMKEADEPMYREGLANWFDMEIRDGRISEEADDADDADDYIDQYDDFLDEVYPEGSEWGFISSPGHTLKEVDPDAFRVGMGDWESEMGEDVSEILADVRGSVDAYNENVNDESYMKLLTADERYDWLIVANDDLESEVSQYLEALGAQDIYGELELDGGPTEFTEFFNTYVAPKLEKIGHDIQAKKKSKACEQPKDNPKEVNMGDKEPRDIEKRDSDKGSALKKPKVMRRKK